MTHQAELPVPHAPVSPEAVRNQPSMTAAIKLAVAVSGKDPKGVYIDLGIDPGHWSRMLSGQAHFPPDKLVALMDILGNEIPLEWLAWQRRKGLHMLETEAERRLRAKDAELDEMRAKLDHFAEFLRLAKAAQ